MIRPAGEERRTRAGKRSECGSALLIVFVFAAIIAIMLYMELPVAVFEAQRQKEELLIDHGNEYAHAVKLFVRKIGTYPASIEALEKTNQMRFLRHRFKDPLTGKDDWRLLHAGPNGTLIDSKVKLPGFGQNTNGTSTSNGLTGNSAFPNSGSSTSSNPFGTGSNSGSGSSFGSSGSNANSAPPEVVVPPLTQRAPAVAANGSGQATGTGVAGGDQNPLAPLLPAGQAEASLGGQQASAGSGSTPGQTATAGQDAAGTGGQNGASSQGGAGNSATGTSTSRSGSPLGTISTGGIAGVASRAGGHSIKTVNDQTDYSLWEFYYDPTKDATRGIAGAAGSIGAAQQANQQQNGLGQSQPQSGFGTSTPFGTSNSSGTTNNPFAGATGFSGNSSQGTNNTNPAPPPTVPPTQPPTPQ